MRAPRPSHTAAPLRQIETMGRDFPQFRYRALRDGGLLWSGALRPTSSSPRYKVSVLHQPGRVPKVFVRQPKLPGDTPHRYDDGSLCVFWPEEFRWNDSELLAKTLLPWAAFWLFYVEIWQITGEWMGPEAPHAKKETSAT